MTGWLQDLGALTLFIGQVFGTARRALDPRSPSGRGTRSRIAEQIVSITLRSLPTVAFAGIFVGAILVLQFNTMLAAYEAQSFLGGLNTSAVVREVGPLIISFLLAGKIGAYTAAELGTMRVTEQIDAIQCLGTNPLEYIIVPRFIGILVASLLLLAVGLMISVLGALVVASAVCNVNPLQYLASIPRFTSSWTIFGGVVKSLVYGTIVGSVACFYGYRASGGARGVGRAVTQAAVYTNLYITIFNYITSTVLESLHVIVKGLLR